jgi:ATP-dependent Clp protease ATP-binding subunit ClpX
MKASEMICSFCRQPASAVEKMVSDPTGKVCICDQCIKVCYSVVSEEPEPAK